MRILPLLPLLVLLSPLATPVPASDSLVAASAEARKLDQFLARMVPFGYSGAILYAKGDRVLLNKGYALADMERGIANTAETVFPLDSVSKQFTAAAILKLEMMGKLSTQDPIAKFFDKVPEDKKNITIHQLLTHTSGLVTGTEEYFERNSRSDILSTVFERPLEFAPGEDFSYCNMGYVLLAALIENVTGMSYERFVVDNLFRPAGMSFTGREIPKWSKPELARRYESGKDNGTLIEKTYPDWNFVGAGGFLSTTGDMFRWHQALKGSRILSEAAKKKLYTPVKNDYAYGWNVSDTDHGKLIEHNGGSSDGSACDFLRFVDQDVTIMIFFNINGEYMLSGSGLLPHVKTLAFGGDVMPPPVVGPPEARPLDYLSGTYVMSPGSRLVLEKEGDGTALRVFGQSAIDAVLSADSSELQVRRRANEITENVLRGLIAGDSSSLREAMFNKDRTAAFYEDLREGIPADGSATFEILGTVPDHRGWSDHVTFFEVATQSGKRMARFHWTGDRIRGLGGSGILEPLKFRVMPTGPVKFAGYNIAESRTIAFRFENESMILENGLTAKRIP